MLHKHDTQISGEINLLQIEERSWSAVGATCARAPMVARGRGRAMRVRA